MSTRDLQQDPARKALIIKGKGGLGNRMLSGVTGLVLARLNAREPYIDWRDGMYVAWGKNLYPELFEADWMGALERFDSSEEVAPELWSGNMRMSANDLIHRHFPNRHQDPFLYRKMSIDLQKDDPSASVAVYWSYVSKLVRIQARLKRSDEFSGRSLEEISSDILSRYFRPVRAVADRVDEIFGRNSGPTIGVHIRFTDRKAPLHKILAGLDRLKREMPYASIFLATDSEEAQEAILSRFPRAKTIDKVLARDASALHFAASKFDDPVTEARNALVDMVALSRCDWLIHSSHSTFSVAATLIGRIPQNRQIDVDRFNPRIVVKKLIQARA